MVRVQLLNQAEVHRKLLVDSRHELFSVCVFLLDSVFHVDALVVQVADQLLDLGPVEGLLVN